MCDVGTPPEGSWRSVGRRDLSPAREREWSPSLPTLPEEGWASTDPTPVTPSQLTQSEAGEWSPAAAPPSPPGRAGRRRSPSSPEETPLERQLRQLRRRVSSELRELREHAELIEFRVLELEGLRGEPELEEEHSDRGELRGERELEELRSDQVLPKVPLRDAVMPVRPVVPLRGR
ncbi:hypothetical protein FJT64_021812 [Amphibalanus amphitrite]|uniref:Uncharacterized protein n=1 Tax=Amphibalanus amphitrite TaxID=1232801 RepID=A0A6A4WWG4_AMPAM|nr:hypothetical protein FJT64_021812 [Amphibalanus amphitrite]